MKFPLQITFRHMPPSRIFEHRIEELARRLEKFSSRIESCHVVIERPPQRTTQGGLFDVQLTINVPGQVIVVSRSHAADPRHADAYVALRDAFAAAKRQLQDNDRIVRGHVKTHAEHPREMPAA